MLIRVRKNGALNIKYEAFPREIKLYIERGGLKALMERVKEYGSLIAVIYAHDGEEYVPVLIENGDWKNPIPVARPENGKTYSFLEPDHILDLIKTRLEELKMAGYKDEYSESLRSVSPLIRTLRLAREFNRGGVLVSTGTGGLRGAGRVAPATAAANTSRS